MKATNEARPLLNIPSSSKKPYTMPKVGFSREVRATMGICSAAASGYPVKDVSTLPATSTSSNPPRAMPTRMVLFPRKYFPRGTIMPTEPSRL